jgi:shikimate dehydrogenase
MISGKTRMLALIGHPVGHSLSPAMHNASFAADGLDYLYVALDVAPGDLPAAVAGLRAVNVRGFNVTMPHKRAILPLLDGVDEGSRVSGAVNTVVTEGSGLRGYNTDGGGLVEACEEAGVEISGRRALLLGAGGAAAAIALAFGAEGVSVLRIVNRSPEHAEELREKLREAGLKNVEVYPYDTLDEAAREAEIVVNATPLGMKDGDPLPLPGEYLDEARTVCDAVYRPGRETALVREARERGTRVVTGQRMLLYQGVLAQRLWTGREPNVKVMDAAIEASETTDPPTDEELAVLRDLRARTGGTRRGMV